MQAKQVIIPGTARLNRALIKFTNLQIFDLGGFVHIRFAKADVDVQQSDYALRHWGGVLRDGIGLGWADLGNGAVDEEEGVPAIAMNRESLQPRSSTKRNTKIAAAAKFTR